MRPLETERLILRSWKTEDLDPMSAIDQDPKVCEYLPGIGNREATTASIQRLINHEKEHGFTRYAVELKSTHELIGFIGLFIPSFHAHFTPAVEIGWRIGSQYWSKGYATEGAKTVLHEAFINLHLQEIASFTNVGNQASQRVMEKIGMHRDPLGDFDHPMLNPDSPLKQHLLYRLSKANYLKSLLLKDEPG